MARRQQSFGGVTALFGEEDNVPPPTRINTKPPKPAGRQASFGGVAALFGGEEDSDDDNVPMQANVSSLFAPNKPSTQTKPTGNIIHDDLIKQKDQYRKELEKKEFALTLEQDRKKELQQQIRDLEASLQAAIESKMTLVESTANEIERMRRMIKGVPESSSDRKSSATVS